MNDETGQPESAGTEVPIEEQAATPAHATEPAQPPAPPKTDNPPHRRESAEERKFKPEYAQTLLQVPGAREWLKEELGVNALEIDNARKEAKALGFSDEDIADFGETPDQIRHATNIAAKHRGQKVEEKPQAEEQTTTYQQPIGAAVRPPENDTPVDTSSMDIDQLYKGMAKDYTK